MRRISLIAAITFTGYTLLFPQEKRIRDVKFFGIRSISQQDIFESMYSRPGEIFLADRLARDLDAMKKLYVRHGFYFAGAVLDSLVWSSDSLEVSPYLSISEGKKGLLGEITLLGNKALPSEIILQSMETRIGLILDASVLERDLTALVARYERIGYPFVTTTVNSVSVLPGDSASLSVEIGIGEGVRVALHEIRVMGNSETSDHVIIRETRITENELFDEDKVSKIPQRLNRLNIFSSVREPQVFVNEAGGGLLLEVEEGRTNTFDGILGYVPSNGGQSKGFVTGMVNIGMRNLFGTARRLQIHWLRDDSYSQEVAVQYTEPWLFDLPLNITAGFFQRQQDSSYVHRTIDLRTEVPFFEVFSVAATLHRDDVIPSGSLILVPVGRSRTLLAGLELLYDTRDDPVSPTGGERYRATYQTGSKRIDAQPTTTTALPKQSTVQKIGIDAEFYFETFARQISAIAMHGRQITTDNLESGDYYRFGGATTLRGYRENQFQGSTIAWTTAEYRFLLARRSFVFGFFDTGFYLIPADDARAISSSQAFLFGYGVGFRLDTSLGNIGVSIALGKGDPPGEAKLHFSLLNDF